MYQCNVRLSKSKKRRLRRQKSKVAKSRVSSQKPTLDSAHHSDLEEHLTSVASFPCPGSTSEVSGQESSDDYARANDCMNSFVNDASQPVSLDLTLLSEP